MSTPAGNPGDAITAALLQITQQAERLAVLDEREAAHCREIAARLAGLAGHVTATGKRVDDIRVTAERPSSAHSTGSTRKSAALATRITGIADTLTSEEDGNLTLAPTGPPRAALVETCKDRRGTKRSHGCAPGWSRSPSRCTSKPPAADTLLQPETGATSRCTRQGPGRETS